MTSSIIPTNPETGTATTSSVRDNFLAAHDEINAIQRSSSEYKVTTNSDDAYSVTFTDSPASLTDGLRVLVQINATNTTTAPTLDINDVAASGAKNIKTAEGAAVEVGALAINGFYDLVYDLSETQWVMLVSKDLDSTALTGTPTAPTAAVDTDTTQIATTAFVQEAAPVDASDTVKGLIELATSAEVKTGTDTVKALTPSNILGVAPDITQVSSSGDQGSITIAGLELKWGLQNIGPLVTDGDVVFDVPFTSYCSCAFASRTGSNITKPASVYSIAADKIVLDLDNWEADVYWFAIGA